MDITDVKKQSGAKKFVSVFGKSTVAVDSAEYKLVQSVTKLLIEHDYGVMHGGYAGGTMEAVAEQAYARLTENNLPLERNIAVPQKQHDEAGWPRVSHATFMPASDDVFARLKIITDVDVAIVAPVGGDGTLLELATIWHENSISNRSRKVVPLIILTTNTGTNWKQLLETMNRELDNGKESIHELPWLHFVDTPNECLSIIESYHSA